MKKWKRVDNWLDDEILVDDSGRILGGIKNSPKDYRVEAWLSGEGTPMPQHLGFYTTIDAAKKACITESDRADRVKFERDSPAVPPWEYTRLTTNAALSTIARCAYKIEMK